MPAATNQQQINGDLKTTSFWLLGAFSLGWLALMTRSIEVAISSHPNAFRPSASSPPIVSHILGTTFLWTLAWLAGGFLFGFLFGIPKVIAATTSTTNPALNDPAHTKSPRLRVNTNLEDISDWLTKVLVGATLTQIVKVPGAIAKAAAFMATNDGSHSESLNAALLVYYSALGLLSGYILTRMFFARAFAFADEPPTLSSEEAEELDSADVRFGSTARTAIEKPSLRRAALASDAIPLSDSLSGDEALRLAKGATVSGDPVRALSASLIALQKAPNDPTAQLTYAFALRNVGASFDAVWRIIEDAARKLSADADPKDVSAVYASEAYLWLYQPAPLGFEKALSILDEYERRNGRSDDAIEINRACAFGQQYSYLKNSGAGDRDAQSREHMERARLGALEAVKAAIKIDPTASIRLKELMWGTAHAEDNDLEAFREDDDFLEVLGRP